MEYNNWLFRQLCVRKFIYMNIVTWYGLSFKVDTSRFYGATKTQLNKYMRIVDPLQV